MTEAKRELWALAGTKSEMAPLGGALFKKELIRVGTWVHPTKDFKVVATRERLARWADTFRKGVAAGIKVPVPLDHSEKAKDNTGYLTGIELDGDSLTGFLEIADPQIAAQCGRTIRDVSVQINQEVKDAHGNILGEGIDHVALTNYPVVTGQENFVRLSAADGAAVEIVRMARQEDQEMAGTEGGGAGTSDDAKIELARVNGEKEQLAQQLAARDAELKTYRLARVEGEISDALAKGKICASDKSKAAMRTLLSADGEGAQKLQLSTKGADGKDVTTKMTPAEAFRQFLGELPDGCVVQLGRKTGAAGGQEGKELTPEEQAKENLKAAGKA